MKNINKNYRIITEHRFGRPKAFGIVEVVIVLAIFCVILGALVWIWRVAMADNIRSQQRAQATYLAQEGIEVVRQIRDSNWIDGDPATTWEAFKLSGSGTTLVKPTEFFLSATPKVDSIRFETDYSIPAPKRFALRSLYTAIEPLPTTFSDADIITINTTEYRRSIYLENYSLPQGSTNNVPVYGINNDASGTYSDGTIYYLKVRSVVIWKGADGNYSSAPGTANRIESSEVLTNWRPNY